MKKMLFLLGFMCFDAFSQVVILNQEDITLDSNNVVLDKPSSSPSFIVLNVPVPTTQRFCIRNEQRQVFGQNGEQCGYDLVERQDCHGGYYGGGYPHPGPGRVVVRRGGGPRGPVGPRPGPVRGGGVRIGVGVGVGFPVGMGCRYYTERVPRSCYFYENFCAEYETRVTDVYKKFNLQFEKFNTPAQISFSLDEHNNLNVDVTSMDASCIKKTLYGPRGGDTTGIKLTLQKRCR